MGCTLDPPTRNHGGEDTGLDDDADQTMAFG